MTTTIDSQTPSAEFITVKQLSTWIGVPVQTLNQWRSRSEGPSWIKLGPHHVRYAVAAVRAWLEAQTRIPTRA